MFYLSFNAIMATLLILKRKKRAKSGIKKEAILELKKELHVSIVAHFYQKDEVFELADFTGDSLQLAQWAAKDANPNLLFCGVGFMGQSVKILAPQKRVF